MWTHEAVHLIINIGVPIVHDDQQKYSTVVGCYGILWATWPNALRNVWQRLVIFITAHVAFIDAGHIAFASLTKKTTGSGTKNI